MMMMGVSSWQKLAATFLLVLSITTTTTTVVVVEAAAAATTITVSGPAEAGLVMKPELSNTSGKSSSTAAAVVDVDRVLNRRPLVDAGLRYSTNDWVITLLTTPFSFILKRIRPHLFFNVLVCLGVQYWYEKNPDISISMTGHSLLASSLGLLVSFRTNSAYGRFWEARGHWTTTKATCRSLAILMKSHMYHQSPKSTKLFLEQLAAFPSCLMHLCLGGAAKLPDHAQRHLPAVTSEEDAELLYREQPTLPAILLSLAMQRSLHEAFLESKTSKWNLVETAEMVSASHMIEKLMEQFTSCEKILRTPVPWTYSRHTSRFLTLWLGSLPFALVGTLKHRWLVLPVTVLASYCLLGIEEIGHLIEQPFVGDPMDGRDRIWSTLDESGEVAALIKRGQLTQPYDIGIPVCSLAAQIRKEVEQIANQPDEH